MIITSTDLLRTGILTGCIVLLLLLSEAARRRMGWVDEVTRKTVHVVTGVLIFFAPPFFPRTGAVILIATLFVATNAAAYAFGWLRAVHHTTRRSFGTVYYPFSLLLLALLFWESAPDLVVTAILVMAIGDGAAGIVGARVRKPRLYHVTSDPKSVHGSTAMFIGSIIALFAGLYVYGDGGLQPGKHFAAEPLLTILVLVAAALFATGWEAASSRGLDNLTVPLATALALHLSFAGSTGDAGGTGHAGWQFVTGSALGAAVALSAYAAHMLKRSGAIATYLLATIIYGIGGWQWTLPIFTFFLLSSLLSKWRKVRKAQFDTVFEKGGRRDAGQVAANGAVVGLLAITGYAFDGNQWYLLSLVAAASVTADTWGTELGILARRLPRSIRTGRRVPAGTSGGVTFAGTAGGALGAVTVTSAALLFIDLPLSTFLLISSLGIAGSLIDSVLGATMQAQYRCHICARETEKRIHCSKPTQLQRGYRLLTNDAVNLLSTVAAVGLGAMLLL